MPGTVLEITEEELVWADDYEVAEYLRVAILASGVDAWVYVDTRFVDES